MLSFQPAPTLANMASYSHFLGSAVKVQYRLGDIFLSASGTFVGDSGRSIFLEQHLEQRGKRNYFRWEIPYPYIHRIEALAEASTEPGVAEVAPASAASKAAAVAASGGSPGTRIDSIPFPARGETA